MDWVERREKYGRRFNPFTADPGKALHFAIILVQPTIFNFWHSGALALRTERQSARMSKIKNGGLDQYGAEPFEHQQFGTAGVEGVKTADVTAAALITCRRRIQLTPASNCLSTSPSIADTRRFAIVL